MGKKRREHVVFDQMLKPKKIFLFLWSTSKIPKVKRKRNYEFTGKIA